jgi:hypothetical protein
MGQCCVHPFHRKGKKKKKTVPQWAHKLNSALAAAQTWHLEG